MNAPPRILIVAGEVSGDMRAAELVRAVRARRPEIAWFGVGGDHLRAAGVEIRYDVRDTAVLGFFEVLRHLRFFRRMFHDLLALARERRPDLAILVDYPGFNLRLARRLHAMGIPVVYYICPQVWAWNRGRIPRVARDVDRLLAIFPFEPAVFAGTGLRVDFVGHPLVDETRAALAAPAAPLPWSGAPRVAILPGSRRQEIAHILPPLADAADRLRRRFPEAAFLVAAPSAEVAGFVRQTLVERGPGGAALDIVTGQTREVLRQADAAWVASGTATIEAALMDCPMVVVYRTQWPTYVIGRLLIRVPYLGMVNVVADRPLCPERLQGDCEPRRLVDAITPLLTGTPQRDAMKDGLAEVRRRLGDGGAAARAADSVLTQLAAGTGG